MAVLQQTFEGGTAGVEITSANSASGGNGANRTFTAPGSVAGSTHTFSLTVTDNDNLTSSADSVTITVLGAAERTASSGSLVTIEQRQA